MTRILLVTLALALAAPAAVALTPLERSVQRDLDEHGFEDVDVRSLSLSQLAAIHHAAHLNVKGAAKRGRIRSILGGMHNLRGLIGLDG